MTLCLFLGTGIILYKCKTTHFDGLRGLFTRMPLTMIGFFIGGFSIIGLPPTCGFFSKWYLITGGMVSGHWEYMIVLMFSTMVMVVLFFRLIERIHLAVDESGKNLGKGHGENRIEIKCVAMILFDKMSAGVWMSRHESVQSNPYEIQNT